MRPEGNRGVSLRPALSPPSPGPPAHSADPERMGSRRSRLTAVFGTSHDRVLWRTLAVEVQPTRAAPHGPLEIIHVVNGYRDPPPPLTPLPLAKPPSACPATNRALP